MFTIFWLSDHLFQLLDTLVKTHTLYLNFRVLIFLILIFFFKTLLGFKGCYQIFFEVFDLSFKALTMITDLIESLLDTFMHLIDLTVLKFTLKQ